MAKFARKLRNSLLAKQKNCYRMVLIRWVDFVNLEVIFFKFGGCAKGVDWKIASLSFHKYQKYNQEGNTCLRIHPKC